MNSKRKSFDFVKRSSFIFLILALTINFALSYKELSVKEIYQNPSLWGARLGHVQWSHDGRELLYLGKSSENSHMVFMAVDPRTAKKRVFFDTNKIKAKFSSLVTVSQKNKMPSINFKTFRFSPDGLRVLFTYKGDIYEYFILSNQLKRLTYTPEKETEVRYSPDGKKVSFVRNYNLFLIDLTKGEEIQVTVNGNKDLTYGVVDWVLGEEFDLSKGYWWSPDSSKLVILRLDESHVPEYPIVDWIPQHPIIKFQKYPKAGDPNPVASLVYYDLDQKTTKDLPAGGSPDIYIPRVNWCPDSSEIIVQVLNRDQNDLKLVLVNPEYDNAKVILEQKDPAWINIHDLLYILKTKPEFIWGSERDGFMHLYLYKMSGKLVNQITSGKWMVTALNGVDEINGKVYFTATKKSPLERHLYLTPISGGKIIQLTSEEGTHNVHISPNNLYFLDVFDTDETPPVYFVGKLDDFGSGRIIKQTDMVLYKPYDFKSFDYIKIKTPDNAILYGRLLKPYNFDPSKKYPVIIYVYGGPHAQVVRKQWRSTYFLWHQLMAQRGFVVFSLDNRGSYGRGKNWERAIYRNFGKKELEDQLIGVEYLKSLPYVDSKNIGIWGWSYGGYMTCMAMFKAPDVFKAGAAVAPVTNWLDYDTIYTERYMDLPSTNVKGYKNSSPINFVQNLKGALLLAHGTSDDNVHFQNEIQILNALIKNDKKFTILYYPLMKHGIRDTECRIHLFENLTAFFEKHLK